MMKIKPMKMPKGTSPMAKEMSEGKLKTPWYKNAEEEQINEAMKMKGSSISGIHTIGTGKILSMKKGKKY